MRPGKSRFMFALVLLVVLASLISACGGGGGAQSGGQKNGASGKQSGSNGATSKKQGGATGGAKSNAPRMKIALGKVQVAKPDKDLLIVKPSKGGKPARFKLQKNVKVLLDGKPAKKADIKKGLQVKVQYVERKSMAVPNRARVVQLLKTGGAGGKTTG